MEFEKLLNSYRETVRKKSKILRSMGRIVNSPNGLNRNEKKIMRRRLIEHKTLQEIGRELDMTRERVRQIEKVAIEKLKSL